MIGHTLGHYLIEGRLGAGGMGVVYRARDLRLQRTVALKVVGEAPAADSGLARLLHEARAASALNHPNVCTIYEVGEADGQPFIVMEYVVGRPLKEVIPRGGLAVEETIRYGIQIADALAHAHERAVVHRDLKSANVMITSEGRAKVLDFGLAQRLPTVGDATRSLTFAAIGVVAGTLAYMAPEVLRGASGDARSDIWALGVLLYESAAGDTPFRGQTGFELTAAILERPVPALPSHVPQMLRGIVQRCLAKDPAERYQHAREVRAALDAIQLGRARFRGKWFAAAAALVMTVALASTVVGPRLFTRKIPAATAPASSTATIAVRRSIAVLGFKNLSGRGDAAWLSTAFSEMLTTELAAGEKLRAISGEIVARTKSDLALAESDSFAKDTLARIRSRLGADLVVVGSYVVLGQAAGGRLRIDLRLQDAVGGDTIASVSDTGSEAELFELVSRTGARLREKLGVGERSAAEAGNVRAALPSNPEAARLYAEGLAKMRVFDTLGARPALENAAALEPQNAMAHAALAAMWSSLGYNRKAADEAQKAFDLSASGSREDRLAIEARYRETTQEWAKAVEIYRTLFSFFPDNVDYGLRLADAQNSAGRPKDALGTIAVLRRLPPEVSDDPRIDLSEATAAVSLSDLKLQLAAAEKAIAKGSRMDARLLVARARNVEGLVYRNTGDDAKAKAAFDEAMRLFTSAGDRNGTARILNNQALVAMQKGDLAGSRKLFEAALATFRDIGNVSGVALALGNIGNVEYVQGHLSGARTMWTETLAAYRKADNKEGVARMLANIGSALAEQADASAARRTFEESLAEYRAIGDKTGITTVLENLAQLLYQQGDLSGSERRYAEVLPLWRDIGNRGQTAKTLNSLGNLRQVRGDFTGARTRYEEALALQREINASGDAARTRLALAALSIDEGRPADAEQAARDAADEFRKEKVADQETAAYDVLARSLLAQRKVDEARKASEQAAGLAQKIDNRAIRLSVALTGARVAAASNKTAEADRRLEAVLEDAKRFGFVEFEFEARLSLGESEMKTAQATGRARLAAVERDASLKGYRLIARKAAEALGVVRPRVGPSSAPGRAETTRQGRTRDPRLQ